MAGSPSIELHRGSCFDSFHLVRDNSVDAIINDPPYGTTQAKWDIAIDEEKMWAEYLRVLKPNGVILLFAAQPFTSKLIMSRTDLFRYVWYWEKEKGTNFLSTGYQPLRVIEEVCVFAHNAKFTYNAQMIPLDKPYTHTMPIKKSGVAGKMKTQEQDANKREYKTYTHSHPKNLVKFARDLGNKTGVATQKPLALMEYLVRTYTDPGHVVLDNTMGSGTTGVACKLLGRSFIGMEMDENHFEIARKRIEETPEDADLFGSA
jgi:DNA modification methylase